MVISLQILLFSYYNQDIKTVEPKVNKNKLRSIDFFMRAWWRAGRTQGKLLDGGWLFPGQNPGNPMSTRQLNRICHMAADTAEIDKRVSPRTRCATACHPSAGTESGYPLLPTCRTAGALRRVYAALSNAGNGPDQHLD